MNDEYYELLEFAAKAAGYQVRVWPETGFFYRCEEGSGSVKWDPLNDDGDAFRLAVRLKMNISHGEAVDGGDSIICCDNGWDENYFFSEVPTERYGAESGARRVIVIAAASLGEAGDTCQKN